MQNLLIKILETFKYPVFRQGSLNSNESYPDTFFTFWNNLTNNNSYYNNKTNNYVWDFDLNIYSTDPDKVNSLLIEAKEKLEKNNFIIDGKGHDIASDELTHTGRGINVKIIE